jgi:uncharacterized tellurite resistance protein B-like protein
VEAGCVRGAQRPGGTPAFPGMACVRHFTRVERWAIHLSGMYPVRTAEAAKRIHPVSTPRSEVMRGAVLPCPSMFGFANKPPAGDANAADLEALVARHLPGADSSTVRIVAAIGGLLATVAYADSHFAPEEEATLREELARVEGLGEAGVSAICDLLRARAAHIAAVGAPGFTRTLRELADRDFRLEILQLLVKLAAADGTISLVEVTLLRQLTTALGLTQEDFNQLQAAHRDKLSFLR